MYPLLLPAKGLVICDRSHKNIFSFCFSHSNHKYLANPQTWGKKELVLAGWLGFLFPIFPASTARSVCKSPSPKHLETLNWLPISLFLKQNNSGWLTTNLELENHKNPWNENKITSASVVVLGCLNKYPQAITLCSVWAKSQNLDILGEEMMDKMCQLCSNSTEYSYLYRHKAMTSLFLILAM